MSAFIAAFALTLAGQLRVTRMDIKEWMFQNQLFGSSGWFRWPMGHGISDDEPCSTLKSVKDFLSNSIRKCKRLYGMKTPKTIHQAEVICSVRAGRDVGVAVDRDFGKNRTIYVYSTSNKYWLRMQNKL